MIELMYYICMFVGMKIYVFIICLCILVFRMCVLCIDECICACMYACFR